MGNVLELLESRLHLTASVVKGVLRVDGLRYADRITVKLEAPKGTAKPSYVTVVDNGATRRFAASTVSSVSVRGLGGNDRIVVKEGVFKWVLPLSISGGDGNDVIDLTLRGSSKISAEAGNDSVYGGNGKDQISGGAGDDLLCGRDGRDVINGGDGCDCLLGGNGADYLTGGTDRVEDSLIGGIGADDTLIGTEGVDVMAHDTETLSYSGPALKEVEAFRSTSRAEKMVYSNKYELIFLLTFNGRIDVVDARTHQVVGTRSASHEFTDLDLTPSGDFLYAADFGGEEIGYGTPVEPSRVHRFNLKTRAWEGSPIVSGVAYRIEAIDDARFVVQSSDQWVSMSLFSWSATTPKLLGAGGGDSEGDIEYDSINKRILHGSSGSTSTEIHAFRLTGNKLYGAEGSGTYGSADGFGETTVLSTDGAALYYGALQVDSIDVAHNQLVFPEMIHAAARNIALGELGYYNAYTSEKLGSLPFESSVYGLAADGKSFWAYDPSELWLHKFEIDNSVQPPDSVNVNLFSGPVLAEKTNFKSSGNARKMVYSEKYNLLFLMNSGSAIDVIDTLTRQRIGRRFSVEQFTDLDLTPSGNYLFAADFGGQEVAGYAIRPSRVHRFNLATRTWEAALKADDIGYRLEALDDQRVVLLSQDQFTYFTVNRWDTTKLTELSSAGADYFGDMEFDAVNNRILYGNSGSSDERASAFRMVGDEIRADESAHADSGAGWDKTIALATDGSAFYYGRAHVSTLDMNQQLVRMLEPIVAASGSIALGKQGYYNAYTGAAIASLPFETTVYAFASDGQSFWAFNPADSTLHKFESDDSIHSTNPSDVNLYSNSTIEELGNFRSPGLVTKMVYSDKYDLLFFMGSGSSIQVVDTVTRQRVSLRFATYQFTDLDLSPSGNYLFAADYGGEEIGYGTPTNPSSVHRYNLATRSWEGPSVTPDIAYHIESVSDTRVLLQSEDQMTRLFLNQWNPVRMTPLTSVNFGDEGDMEYDAKTGRVFRGRSSPNSDDISAWHVSGETIEYSESHSHPPIGYQAPLVLSTDGGAIYLGSQQFNSHDVTQAPASMPEWIYAASASIALGENGYYRASSGEKLGSLPFSSTRFAFNEDGSVFWTYNPNDATLHQFRVR